MLPRFGNILNVLKTLEKNIFNVFGQPSKEYALVQIYEKQIQHPKKSLTINDIIGDGILLAVPKFRRTIEKRWKRKFGSPDYVWKMLVPKTNIKVCRDCGHHHEHGRLCENCYKRVENETKEIKAKIQEKLGGSPIDKDVIVLYEGEDVANTPKEFWEGKRIIEMKKERPQWFSKNLLQKTTQQPSSSTDVKPTDLA
ncbi:large ribosomal subunit protein bL32m [Battus philenor]|uniref:large ribosomal subunit protein bL32m n=1 Tax=Battus philenor TaxID=42288 RepID=UPI0035CFC238